MFEPWTETRATFYTHRFTNELHDIVHTRPVPVLLPGFKYPWTLGNIASEYYMTRGHRMQLGGRGQRPAVWPHAIYLYACVFLNCYRRYNQVLCHGY